ncbi:MAG: hypothetical protein IJ488_04625 [Clostridia bacterium]|nr:hypothetical protein [Clostridia bacterium]
MKNRKTAKLLVLILSLALLIGSAVGIAVSAEGAKTPEIISKNVYYGGNNHIMYAVDASTVNEGPVTLYFYDDADKAAALAETDWTYTADAPVTEKIGGEEKSVYVFNTLGIAPTEFTKNFYAVAVDSTDAKSVVVRYSLLEYYLDMLYRNDIKSATSGEGAAMKAVFENEIASAASIQDLLFNYNDTDTDDLPYVADDYYYAAIVDGATIDGAYSSGIYTPGSKITLTSTDGSVATWQVTVYNSDYSVKSSEKVANGTQITLEGHTLITVPEIPTTGVIDFEDGIPAELGATEANASGSITLGNDATTGDNYMLFNTTGAGSADALPSFTVPVKTNDDDADTFVFGYDMLLNSVSYTNTSTNYQFLQLTAYAGEEIVYSVRVWHNGDRIRLAFMTAKDTYSNSTDISNQISSDSWRVSRQEDQSVAVTNAHTERQMYFVYNATTDSVDYYNNNGNHRGTLADVFGANLLPDKVVVTAVNNTTKLSARIDNIVTENYKLDPEEQGITFDPHTLNNTITITEREGIARVQVDEETGDNYLYVKSDNLQSVDTSYRNPNMYFPITTTEGANTYEFSADINILYLEYGWSLNFNFGDFVKADGNPVTFGLKYYAGEEDNRIKFIFSNNTNNATLPEIIFFDKVSNGDGYNLGTEFNFRFVATVVGDTTEIRVYRDGNLVNEEPIIYAGAILVDSAYLECGKEMKAEFTFDNVYSGTKIVSDDAE